MPGHYRKDRPSPRLQRGFTFLELVLVIVILGILGLVMMPRFIDLTDGAHKAAVSATAGAFETAVNMVHIRYLSLGLSGAQDDLPGYGDNDIDVNTQGYPTDTNGGNTINLGRCVRVWNGILMSAPSAAQNTGTDPDYLVSRAGQICTYTYRRDTSVSRSFTYDATTGAVTLSNP